MKLFLLLSIIGTGLLCFSTSASAASNGTPFVQQNILRVAPDDSAPFVPIAMPIGGGGEPEVELLAHHGEWEEVKLHYRFKYNGSTDPNVCKMSLFEGSFTGFRKVSQNR